MTDRELLEEINDKLDNIAYTIDDLSELLENQSRHLYEIAKYHCELDERDYRNIFEEMMGDPVMELNKTIESLRGGK